MSGVGTINLKVVIFESDYYALQSINSYLAWDRRTRVTFMTTRREELWRYLEETPVAELPDVVVLDADHLGGSVRAAEIFRRLQSLVPEVSIICLVQSIDPELVETAASMDVLAFMLKDEVRLQLAWAIIYAREHDFTVTPTVLRDCRESRNRRIYNAAVLPEQRTYPEMTDRVRQAIRLCVVEGMPAHLAADEMGISLHTIRGYVKDGYRILESYDQHDYPTDMTPQERAFMRFTALAEDD